VRLRGGAGRAPEPGRECGHPGHRSRPSHARLRCRLRRRITYCVINCVARFVEICVRNMGIVAAFWRSQPPFCNGPLRSNAKTAKALGLTVPELLVEAVIGSCDRPARGRVHRFSGGTRPRLATCFECLDATEREIASGQCGVGCRGCYRIMTPLVEPFRRDDVFAGMRLACRASSQATAAGPVLRSVPHQVPEAEGLQPGLALPI
jgi:hypothetical protein